MYKVLIADDEKIIRMGLKSIINWSEYGFNILWEAANGEDAVKIITEESPDLVMIDIKMPKMHGLDAIKSVRDAGFKGKIVILSGFNEFTYAQTAIGYGISAYLTKPVEVDNLVGTLLRIKKELDSTYIEKQSVDTYKTKAREVILSDFLQGNIDESEIDVEDLGLSSAHYQVIVYEKFSENEELSYDLADLLRVTSQDGIAYVAMNIKNTNVFLLMGKRPIENLNHLVEKYYAELPPEKNSPLDTIFITCGSVVKDYREISKSYNEAIDLLKHRFFCDEAQHFMIYSDYEDEKGKRDVVATRNDILEKYTFYLSNQIQAFNRNKIADSLLDLKKTLYSTNFTVEEEKKILIDLYLNIKESMNKLSDSYSIPFIANSEAVNFINRSYYLYEILQFLSEQFDMIMTSIGYSSRDSIIDDVIFYIQHNYSKNITLENIAPLFGYNSSYLGKIFSRKVGVNFNTYLDTIRIEHSKEILISSKTQVYKVAEMVGYRNVDYFHIKFKKHTGQSPAEYRKSNS